ncbi:hypothetical protein AB4Z01_26150 [Inquilinus sp. YAF38]|uniref:hypothetical protein n=1 Tax=Inquilinus sp. YAF38 TaxID=3233084 RepID=UPI003F921EFA
MRTQEALPNIDIAVTIDGRTFLERMSDYGAETGRFTIERHYDALREVGFHVINFRNTDPSAETDFGGQLIVRPKQPNRIAIEMRAPRWPPDPPTRESYAAAARAFFLPLLQTYNRQFGTRYRIRIAKVPRPFKLPPSAEILFSRFCVMANTSGLHHLDWQRFYSFVQHSRTEVPEGTMRHLLVQVGFSDHYAERLADIYTHLWAFKQHN